jgi:hypothetical protein
MLARAAVRAFGIVVPPRRRRHDQQPELDAEALAAIGIDLDEVRRRVEESFGPEALDRTRAARRRD